MIHEAEEIILQIGGDSGPVSEIQYSDVGPVPWTPAPVRIRSNGRPGPDYRPARICSSYTLARTLVIASGNGAGLFLLVPGVA